MFNNYSTLYKSPLVNKNGSINKQYNYTVKMCINTLAKSFDTQGLTEVIDDKINIANCKYDYENMFDIMEIIITSYKCSSIGFFF